jgi:hypothetical protein
VQNNTSKINLLVFLFEVWYHSFDTIPAIIKIFMSGGFENRLNMKVVSSDAKTECPMYVQTLLTSTHEVADSRLFQHVKVALTTCCERVVVIASDTDIVVIATYLFDNFRLDGLLELFIQTKDYVIPIHSLVAGFSTCERAMMSLMHALSVCDTNGFMFGKGKVLFYKAVQQTNTATDLGRFMFRDG